MLRKIISLMISILLVSTCTICFAQSDGAPKFINDVEGRRDVSEFINRDDYEFLTMKVKDVVFYPETNTVTFKNPGKRPTDYTPDTNTYVINNDTALDALDDGTYLDDVQSIIDGERNLVTIILETEVIEQILSGLNDSTIFVDAFWGSYVSSDNNVTDDDLKSLLPEGYIADNSCQRLIKYKIMQGDELGNLNLDAYATRAEMAQFAVNALNMAGIPPYIEQGSEFSDVFEGHWAFNAVMMAKNLGIINGNGDGTFLPGNFVTYDEAVKIVVEILGYKSEAEKRGGYPYGYASVAKLIGIIGEYDGQSYIPRGDIASMLEASLDVPLMQQTGFGSKPEFTIAKGDVAGKGRVTLENSFK